MARNRSVTPPAKSPESAQIALKEVALAARAPEPRAPLFGAHMSVAGGIQKAVYAAHAIGFGTVQVFTKNNNQWRGHELTDAAIEAFRGALAETGVTSPVAHTSYLINLASPDEALWQKSIDAMTVEVERCAALGIEDLVVHPGAHLGTGEDAGLARVAAALDEVGRRTRGLSVMVDLETTAGQGTCLGASIEHLGRIAERVREPERLGLCGDTCHLSTAGYALDSDAGCARMAESLERIAGLLRERVWHLNDSKRELGSRVDRHEAIGRGKIGLEAFRRLVNDPRRLGLPMILETPKGVSDGEEWDAINLRVLRGLAQGKPPRRRSNKV